MSSAGISSSAGRRLSCVRAFRRTIHVHHGLSIYMRQRPYTPAANAVRAGQCGHRSNASYDGQNGEVMQAGGKARNTMVVGADEAAGKLP